MVSWGHIFWVAPAFAALGFITCGLLVSAGPITNNEEQIEKLQLDLFEAEKKLDTMCEGCVLSIELNAKMKDIEALLETQKQLKRSNSRMNATLQRLYVKGRMVR
jgi:hypothetical protein